MTIKRRSLHIVPMSHSWFCWWRHNRLLMTSQWLDNCDAITWIVISNSLDIDYIHGDTHDRVYKKYDLLADACNHNPMMNKWKTISFCAISLEINHRNVHCFSPVLVIYQWTESTLVQVVCRPLGTQPLPNTMRTGCKLDLQEHTI